MVNDHSEVKQRKTTIPPNIAYSHNLYANRPLRKKQKQTTTTTINGIGNILKLKNTSYWHQVFNKAFRINFFCFHNNLDFRLEYMA